MEASSSLFSGFLMFFLGAVVSGMERLGIDSYVSDFHLNELLEKRHIKSSFDNGKVLCAGCGTTINRGNLGLIIDKSHPDFV